MGASPPAPPPDALERDSVPTAGLLARGSWPTSAFPGLSPSAILDACSPPTVAGAAAAYVIETAPRSLWALTGTVGGRDSGQAIACGQAPLDVLARRLKAAARSARSTARRAKASRK